MKKIFFFLFIFAAFVSRSMAQQATLQEDLALKYLVQLPAEKPEKAQRMPVIILLHGYGSDEKDLFDLRNFFPKNYLIVSVRAPYALSAGGYQWYEGTTADGQRDGKKDQLDNSRTLIMKFESEVVKKYKADAKNVYLIGFSQGAIMSYEAGLTNPGVIRGIGVLSGMIFNSLRGQIRNTPTLKQLKIFISHGTDDQRIAYSEAKTANDYLKVLGLKPDFHTYDGMGHQINKEVLKDLLAWLNNK